MLVALLGDHRFSTAAREYHRQLKAYKILLPPMPIPNRETPCYHIEVLLADEFRCVPGYEVWRSRGTQEWTLIHTVSGVGLVGTGTREHRVEAGHTVVFQPGTPQHYLIHPSSRTWRMVWCHFNLQRDWRMWLDWPEIENGLLHVETGKKACRRIEPLLREVVQFGRHALDPFGLAKAVNALERALLLIYSEDGHRTLDTRVSRALRELDARWSQKFNIASLARSCGLSTSRLAHLFSEQMGVSPQRYHEQIRLQKAAMMLRSTESSVKQISEQVGYENAFYFTNRFRNAYGRSPTAFRNGTANILIEKQRP